MLVPVGVLVHRECHLFELSHTSTKACLFERCVSRLRYQRPQFFQLRFVGWKLHYHPASVDLWRQRIDNRLQSLLESRLSLGVLVEMRALRQSMPEILEHTGRSRILRLQSELA